MTPTPQADASAAVEDQVLADLIEALRAAQAQAPGAASSLALAAFIAVYGFPGVASASKALRSS